jgi:hypothetical protein
MEYDMTEPKKEDKWMHEFVDLTEKADGKADEIIGDGQTMIEKIKKSKWSALALVGGSVALLALLFK